MRLAAQMRLAEGQSHADLAARAKRLGYAGVSIGFDPAWTDADLVAIRQACDDQGVEIVELGCTCNVVTPRDDEAAEAVERLGKALQAGALLNCDHVTTCAGSRHPDADKPLAPHPDNWADETWDLLIRRIWSLLARVDDLGVCLCFEPRATTTLNSLDSLAELAADASSARVRIALDPAAIFTPAAARAPSVGLAETFGRLADTIALVRATDVALIEAGDEPRCVPAPLGEGVLDYGTLLKLADALELDTPIVVKPQGSDGAYGAARDFLVAAAKQAMVEL